MLPRPTRQDGEEWEIEKRYGKPQHEVNCPASEQELYGDPQHDVSEKRSHSSSDFDLDLGYALDLARLDFVREVRDTERRLPLVTER